MGLNRLSGKVAIITGAAQGIGKGFAIKFVEEGAKVVATDLNLEGLKETVEGIKKTHGNTITALKHDVSSEEEWKAVCQKAVERFGGIDLLVNNAAYCSNTNLFQSTVEIFHKTMNANALGTLLGILAVTPYMQERKAGSIVNMSSIAGLKGGMGGGCTYSMSKGAITILTKDAAIALAPFKIRVNSIHPSAVLTPALESFFEQNPHTKEPLMQAIPLNDISYPIDIANVAVFLASDESRYVTGSQYSVDGGINAR